MSILMHGYTFRNYSYEEALRNAKRFGWDGIELHSSHFAPANVKEEVPLRVAQAEEAAVPVKCLDYSAHLIEADNAAWEAAVASVEAHIDTAAALGITLMNGYCGWLAEHPTDFSKNGSALATEAHYERAAEALRYLGAHAARSDITLAVEIHMNTIHDTIKGMTRLLDAIALDNVQATPDPGNMFSTCQADRDPNALDALAGRIGHLHLKNAVHHVGHYHYSTRLDEGHIDLYAWLQKLHSLGYDGDITVEYCGEGDPRVAAERDLPYLRRCLDWIREA